MKRILFALALVCLAGRPLARETVTITYFDVPPHVIYDPATKKVSGAVVDLLEYLAPDLDVELVWDPSPSNIPRQMSQLETGGRDMAAVFIYNPADLTKFAYSEKPYFLARDGLLVKTSNPLGSIAKLDDILSWTIGYAADTYRSEFMRDGRIKWDNNPSPEFNALNVKKLLAGRLDAVYAPDHAALLYSRKAARSEQTVKVLYTPQAPVPLSIGFSHKNPAIKKKFDEAFAKRDGAKKYADLLSKYIGMP